MGVKAAGLIVLGLVVATLTGCTGGIIPHDPVEPRSETATTAPIPPPDSGDFPARKVTIPTGQQVANLAPETRAQVLCAVLDTEELQRILQAPVELRRRAGGECSVFSTRLRAQLTLASMPLRVTRPHAPIVGRPTTSEIKTADPSQYAQASTELSIRLFDDLPDDDGGLTPLLHIRVDPAPGDYSTERTDGEALRAAELIVPRLTRSGDRLPDSGVFVRSVPAPGAGIVDLAIRVRTNQLCTAALDVLGENAPQGVMIEPLSDYCSVSSALPTGDLSKPSRDDDHWWTYTLGFARITEPGPAPGTAPRKVVSTGPNDFGVYLTAPASADPLRISVSGDNGPLPVAPRDFAERVVNALL